MSLLALPNEIIHQISERIHPHDIESYGRINRRFRILAAPFVQEHRSNQKIYRKTSLDHVLATKLIYEMAARPWLRFYPRYLELRANKHWKTLESVPRATDKAEHVDAIRVLQSRVEEKDIRSLLRMTRLIPEHEIEKWLEAIERGEEDYVLALMLACLPNVKRLIIRLDHDRLEQVKDMVRAIRRQSQSPSKSENHHVALSKLIDGRILEREGSDGDLELFPLIASLPGVQVLHGRNLVGMYRECYRDGWMTYPGASPTITHIYLETCGMSVEGLEKLCDSIKGLRSFKYVAHRSGWGLQRISDLLKKAHTTLEELVLSTGAGDSRCVGSLKKFTALKHLTIDTDMLMKKGKIIGAVELLPGSIETAVLAGNSLSPKLEEEFLHDLFKPSFFYPKLKKLSVENSWGLREIGKDRLSFQQEHHRQLSSSWMQRYR